MKKDIEVTLFEQLNLYVETIKDLLKTSYLNALFLTSRDILDGHPLGEWKPDEYLKLDSMLKDLAEFEFQKDELRKTLVATTLKGYKIDQIQNSEMTPDVIALLVGYVASFITKGKEEVSILDPVVGTANMITAVANMLKANVNLVGIDSNLDSIQLARVFADLQGYDMDLLLEDTITSGLNGFDLIVADVPLYLYDDEYFPHVLLDKWVDGLNTDGWLVFVIPNDFFEIEGSFKDGILTKTALQGIVQLPRDLFVDEKLQKSILIARKIEHKIDDFLLLELPSLQDESAFRNAIRTIDGWFMKEKENESN